jgi:hypothetical protein
VDILWAVLVGLEERRAVIWRIFTEVAKPDGTVEPARGTYDLNESVVNGVRPALREGVRSIIVVAPPRTDYAKSFLDHIRKHHAWLIREGPNAATFGEMAMRRERRVQAQTNLTEPKRGRLKREPDDARAQCPPG